jgi:hypothetical protein
MYVNVKMIRSKINVSIFENQHVDDKTNTQILEL